MSGAMPKPMSEQADALEAQMSRELEKIVVKSILFESGEKDPTAWTRPAAATKPEGPHFLMGADPRLKPMPEKPTLIDFFKYRMAPAAHLLQSAKLALDKGLEEKIVIACLLHDIAVMGFIRGDHGHWGAQLVEPYVSEEVAWAIRAHQSLRFFADESVGYEYPQLYVRFFGPDYQVEPYLKAEYERARAHKWYMTGRLITLNDLYAFDPNVKVEVEDFTDIIGRNFRQPPEGLGFDNTSASHMWRTMMMPTRFL